MDNNAGLGPLTNGWATGPGMHLDLDVARDMTRRG